MEFNAQAQQRNTVIPQNNFDFTYLDDKSLRAMLMSLLTNSIKDSPSESEIRLTVTGEEHRVFAQVQDQGIGIPLADQQHLVESFRRGNNVDKIPGADLGVVMVKRPRELRRASGLNGFQTAGVSQKLECASNHETKHPCLASTRV